MLVSFSFAFCWKALQVTFRRFAMVGNRSINLQFCTKVEPKNNRGTLQFRLTIAKPLLAVVFFNQSFHQGTQNLLFSFFQKLRLLKLDLQ